jgi:putative FmdB family regulatory protein
MPLYEYSCTKCEHTFEALVFDGEAVACPECQTDRVERLLSVPARPQTGGQSLPMGGCDPSLPPCGAAGCRRMG